MKPRPITAKMHAPTIAGRKMKRRCAGSDCGGISSYGIEATALAPIASHCRVVAGTQERVTRRAIATWPFLKSEPRNQVRTRLPAGGRWIRTSGSAPAATPLTDRGVKPQATAAGCHFGEILPATALESDLLIDGSQICSSFTSWYAVCARVRSAILARCQLPASGIGASSAYPITSLPKLIGIPPMGPSSRRFRFSQQ